MIKSFIFFDLETTGLISQTMPKIIELSLIAVSRSAICDTMTSLPRVLHKLVLPIHPNIDISPKINQITGLSTKNLEQVPYFNCQTYNLIMEFINQQTTPVCFVAYNGNKFDYPIFLSELKNINKNFSEDILSIDMLHLIKDYYSTNRNLIKERDVQNTSSVSNTEGASSLLNDGWDEMLCDALDFVTSSITDKHNKNNQENKESNSCSNNGLNTPKTSCYKKMQEMNEKTPESQVVELRNVCKNLHDKKGSTARRKLHFTNNNPSDYKLSTVYKHIVGTDPVNAHSAEGDCLTMIRCAIQLGKYFVEWADYKATPFIKYERH